MAEKLMTVKLAAIWFGVTPSTVRSWVADRRVPSQGQIGNAKLYSFATLCVIDRETRLSNNLRKQRIAGHTAF